MPNPFYMEALRLKTGLDKAVSDYVFSFQQTRDFLSKLEDLLTLTLPLYAEEGKTSLTIAVGCTGGQHRSVAVAHGVDRGILHQAPGGYGAFAGTPSGADCSVRLSGGGNSPAAAERGI